MLVMKTLSILMAMAGILSAADSTPAPPVPVPSPAVISSDEKLAVVQAQLGVAKAKIDELTMTLQYASVQKQDTDLTAALQALMAETGKRHGCTLAFDLTCTTQAPAVKGGK